MNPAGKAAAIKANGDLFQRSVENGNYDAQPDDEGIEDGAELVGAAAAAAKKSIGNKNVAKDEGIDDEDGKVG